MDSRSFEKLCDDSFQDLVIFQKTIKKIEEKLNSELSDDVRIPNLETEKEIPESAPQSSLKVPEAGQGARGPHRSAP